MFASEFTRRDNNLWPISGISNHGSFRISIQRNKKSLRAGGCAARITYIRCKSDKDFFSFFFSFLSHLVQTLISRKMGMTRRMLFFSPFFILLRKRSNVFSTPHRRSWNHSITFWSNLLAEIMAQGRREFFPFFSPLFFKVLPHRGIYYFVFISKPSQSKCKTIRN